VLSFGANDDPVVTLDVSRRFYHWRQPTDAPEPALYQADKEAHEEAVQNGGVSARSAFTYAHQVTSFASS
jgi:hypothetical protein